MLVREPLNGGRWRIVERGSVIDSRPTLASAIRRMREIQRERHRAAASGDHKALAKILGLA